MERTQTEYINYWIPSKESYEVFNLTKELLFIPNYVQNDIGKGSWNDNAYVFDKSNYYIVLAYKNEHYSIGVIKV